MNALPSFLETALVSLQDMIEGWDLISVQITNEQLQALKHGCDLLKETHQKVETNINIARLTPTGIEIDRGYELRGQRFHYEGSAARSESRRKRRRTGERQPANNTMSSPQSQVTNEMLESPESIEDARNSRQERIRSGSPGIREQSPIEPINMPSPATSSFPNGSEKGPETLFIPEHGDDYNNHYEDNHVEPRISPEVESDQNGEFLDNDLCAPSVLDDAYELQDVLETDGEPDLFLKRFDDFIEKSLSHPFPNDMLDIHYSSPTLMQRQDDLSYITSKVQDLVTRQKFWLPHENRSNPSTIATPDQILEPLTNGKGMTPDVMHGILYRILPDVFDIVDYRSNREFQEDLGRLVLPSHDRTVAIISDTTTELVLIDTCKRRLTYLTSRQMLQIDDALTLPPEWMAEIIIPHTINSSIEYTLLSIHLIEAECKAYRRDTTCTEEDLRRRYLEALLVCEEQQAEPPNDDVPIQTEIFATRPAEADDTAETPSIDNSAEFHVDEIDPTLLEEALARRPKNMKDTKCLRILQYIHGTGCPQVLDQLKVTAMSLERHIDLVTHDPREVHAARISAIHTALDSRGSTSHFGIVQSRYARLCYYREYQHAVESLRRSNKPRRVERQKLARRQQRLGHVAEDEQSHLMPQTIAMAQQYSETTGRSSSIVRDDVVRRLSIIYSRSSSEDLAEIKSQVDSYIRQGKILHLILQGCSSNMSPALLLLIPTIAITPLDVTCCVQDESSKQKLRRRFKPNEIDDLSETEAQWMGEALKILRPEILREPPAGALKLLNNRPAEIKEVSSRDSKQFAMDPFGFFA